MFSSLECNRWLPHGDTFFNFGNPNVIKASIEYRLDDTEQVAERLRRKSNKFLLIGDYSSLINLSLDIDYQLEMLDEISKERIQGSLVKSWLIEAYQATRNRSADDHIPKELIESQLVREGRVSEKAYKAVIEIWKRMSDYKNGKVGVEIFNGVEDLSIFSDTGLLAPESTEYDSEYQQSRIALMTIKGLNYDQLSWLISFAQIERSSRSKTGKLPAVMNAMISSHAAHLSDQERMSLYNKSIYNWGTPGERTIKNKDRSHGEKIRAYKSAKSVVLAGGRPPTNYGLSSRALNKLEKLYNDLHPGWNKRINVEPEVLYQSDNLRRNKYGVVEISQSKDKAYSSKSLIHGLLDIIGRFVET